MRRVVNVLAAAAAVGAVLALAGPAAASNVYCGEHLTASVTLVGNLNCSGAPGKALYFGHAGVTLNLNRYTVTGRSGYDVIDDSVGYGHVTVENGTLVASGGAAAVNDLGGGSGVTVSKVTMTSDGNGSGVYADAGGSGLVVSGCTVRGFYDGVYLHDTVGAAITGNTITTPANDTGVSESSGTSDAITGNTFTSAAGQTGVALATSGSAETQFGGNTVIGMNTAVRDAGHGAGLRITSNTMSGNDYGIYLSGSGSGDVVSGNYIRNSFDYGVYDYRSAGNTYSGNVLTSNARGFYVDPGGHGEVTMTNNFARLSGAYGFDVEDAYGAGSSSTISGNTALGNGSYGFFDTYSPGAVWSKNTATSNGGQGFWFVKSPRETISGNVATGNGADGFLFQDEYVPDAPLAVSGNSSTHNAGYGFDAQTYPVAGSGNTGGSTNGLGDCHLVAGCK